MALKGRRKTGHYPEGTMAPRGRFFKTAKPSRIFKVESRTRTNEDRIINIETRSRSS